MMDALHGFEQKTTSKTDDQSPRLGRFDDSIHDGVTGGRDFLRS